jgi:hypothetical protein
MIKSSKDRGAWAELCFAMRAMQEGLRPATPWGEPKGYDFLVDGSGANIFRVQVKSTIRQQNSWYQCTVRTMHAPYKKNAFLFLAAFVVPENVWYIVPGKLVWGQQTLGFNPKLSTEKYGQYKEAWDLLRGETPGIIPLIQACAEETPEPWPEESTMSRWKQFRQWIGNVPAFNRFEKPTP